MKPKILIADDHQLFNDGLKGILSVNFQIVSQVFDGKSVIPQIIEYSPHLAILDMNLPHIKGHELAVEIKRSFQKVKVILLTIYNEPSFVDEVKKIPIDGYILKDSPKEVLIKRIKTVLKGKTFFDPKLQTTVVNLNHGDYFMKRFALSPREVEIISLIKNGQSTNQIADTLFISDETVKSHRKNIHFKLGINKLTEIINFAREHKI